MLQGHQINLLKPLFIHKNLYTICQYIYTYRKEEVYFHEKNIIHVKHSLHAMY